MLVSVNTVAIFGQVVVRTPNTFHKEPFIIEPSALSDTLFFQIRVLSNAHPAMRL